MQGRGTEAQAGAIMATLDGRIARGIRSRPAIVKLPADIASVDGLDSLSIGGLATRASLSKSGVIGLFGSKEELQLATVAAAREVFVDNVIKPALEKKGGIDRLHALVDAWLRYSEYRVFTGGCFFAAATAELGARQGPVRDAIAQAMDEWNTFVARTVSRAIERGELQPPADADQIAFEITAILDAANARSLLFDSTEPYAR